SLTATPIRASPTSRAAIRMAWRLTPAPGARNAGPAAGDPGGRVFVDNPEDLWQLAHGLPSELRPNPLASRSPSARPDRRRADIVPGRRMLGTPRQLAALACAVALLETVLAGAATHRRPARK